ncbi:MAG TPA: TonB-dependent receptor [Candidatus Polarisedimenticolia bacterium]|nr:TonB-dependent receptor [Candidatus Polarisedimenticolia bacterium]
MRKRSGGFGFSLVGFLIVVWSSHVVAAERPLAGRVVDPFGSGVEGADIFVTPLGRELPSPLPRSTRASFDFASGEIEALRSAPDGSFATLLPAGHYRLAAFKPGYQIDLVDVNTLVRETVELRLKEAARIFLGDLPVGAPGQNLGLDWILRRPSDVLRETEAALPGAGEGGGEVWEADARSTGPVDPPKGRLEALLQPIDGEFTQDFSGSNLSGGDGSGPAETSGRRTSLALRGAIGGQGKWRFDGLTGRAVADSGGGSGGVRQDREADRMILGMDYRLGPADELRSVLRYGSSRYVVDPNGETVNATDQEQRTVGFRSRWERSLGSSAQLYVDGAYFETGVRVPDGASSPFAAGSGPGGLDRVTDRSWLATSGVIFSAGEHRLDFGLRAKRYRYEGRDRGVLLYNLVDAPTLAEPGERGDAVSVFGNDDWRLADGSVLNYGLRYHGNLASGGAYFVPRVGWTSEPESPGGTRFRSMLMLRVDDPGFSSLYASSAERRAATRPDVGRIGYLIGIERRPEDRLQVAATLSYRPFEEGLGGEDEETLVPGAWGDALLFLTDGAAGRHELGVELQRGFGAISGSLSGSVGRVEGRLTPAIEEAPVQILSLGEIRYYLTRLRAQYGPTETAVQIDYRHVDGTGGGETSIESGTLDYRRLDLVIYQDLPWIRGAGNARFKVLMAYQGLMYGSGQGEAGRSPAPGSGSRLTGGVDISF